MVGAAGVLRVRGNRGEKRGVDQHEAGSREMSWEFLGEDGSLQLILHSGRDVSGRSSILWRYELKGRENSAPQFPRGG